MTMFFNFFYLLMHSMHLVVTLTVHYLLWVKIAKFNTETKEMAYWTEENCWPSEPVFVPRPNGESEDDGKNTLHHHDAIYTIYSICI